MEEWREVSGLDGWYEVSSEGRVRSWHETGQRRPARREAPLVLRLQTTAPGYRRFTGYGDDGVPQYRMVHREVCRAFHREPLEGEVARHLNGVRTDNRPENLAWGTPAENCRDRDLHGTTSRGERHARAVLDAVKVRDIRARAATQTVREIADAYGTYPQIIRAVVQRRTWAHVA